MGGLHHVTAIAGNASRNLDFYTRVLGMRLVKKTVNFDDPSTYHLYYGDEAGLPGSILTFFPWDNAATGRHGIGSVQEVLLRVPIGSLSFWIHRFVELGVNHQLVTRRFGEPLLAFTDPDGLALALVGSSGQAEPGWSNGAVPAEHAIQCLHGVGLLLAQAAATSEILVNIFNYKAAEQDGTLLRLTSNSGRGDIVDIREAGDFLAGRMGRGSVHHIAFVAKDDEQQAWMADRLRAEFGLHPTDQKDRLYFRSVYFREPGGILFEIATEQPGFGVDEPLDLLGSSLKLPPFLESRRSRIEATLPLLGQAA
jgi:glyoxalase family protein